MNIASFVVVGFAVMAGAAACTPATVENNAERTAACADRTNNISCQTCCKTEQAAYANNVCTCKGKPEAPK
ncbi:MAG: hypothetical protein JWP87_400 [Labilithrix sp.]|nr:hypothetical protein [Labilithrix sp.]